MRMYLLVLCVAMLLLSGCAVTKQYTATGGSRSDATVKLSYEYDSMFEIPTVDEQQGLELAIQRCKTWGYTGAEAFGGAVREHVGRSDSSVVRITKEYQCTGQGTETSQKKK